MNVTQLQNYFVSVAFPLELIFAAQGEVLKCVGFLDLDEIYCTRTTQQVGYCLVSLGLLSFVAKHLMKNIITVLQETLSSHPSH